MKKKKNMKTKFQIQVEQYLAYGKTLLLPTIVIAGLFFALYHERPAKAMFDNPAEGAFSGAATGALFGGLAAGGRGAVIGAGVGAVTGAAIGAASERQDPNYELDRLYRKREELEYRIANTNSPTLSNRLRRYLERVNENIARYESGQE